VHATRPGGRGHARLEFSEKLVHCDTRYRVPTRLTKMRDASAHRDREAACRRRDFRADAPRQPTDGPCACSSAGEQAKPAPEKTQAPFSRLLKRAASTVQPPGLALNSSRTTFDGHHWGWLSRSRRATYGVQSRNSELGGRGQPSPSHVTTSSEADWAARAE
jgi:hypothetical protein